MWNFPHFWTGPPPPFYIVSVENKIYGLKQFLEHSVQKKIYIQNEKNYENFHKILTMSKHSHSEVGYTKPGGMQTYSLYLSQAL